METYRENLEISTRQWLELLQDRSVFKDEDIALMKTLYNCRDCREKASVLAAILGFRPSSFESSNRQTGEKNN